MHVTRICECFRDATMNFPGPTNVMGERRENIKCIPTAHQLHQTMSRDTDKLCAHSRLHLPDQLSNSIWHVQLRRTFVHVGRHGREPSCGSQLRPIKRHENPERSSATSDYVWMIILDGKETLLVIQIVMKHIYIWFNILHQVFSCFTSLLHETKSIPPSLFSTSPRLTALKRFVWPFINRRFGSLPNSSKEYFTAAPEHPRRSNQEAVWRQ